MPISNKPYLDSTDRDLTCEYKSTIGDATFPYHRHNNCEIYLFLKGNVQFYIEHACYQLSPYDLIIMNPEEMHRIVCIDDSLYERITINIKKSYMDQLSNSTTDLSACFYHRPIGTGNILSLTPKQSENLFDLCNLLDNAISSTDYGHSIQKDAYLSLLLVLVNSIFKKNTSNNISIMPEYLIETMEYIESNLSETISLQQLGNRFHQDRNYLSQQFKKHTGMTLRFYLLDRRIARAKSLLRSGCNVTEACYQSGFKDYANFIRSFTKLEGTSPGKFKKA
jgi:YesN/AraC family two-component response regulator